jgi:hypothetical protein
MENLIVEIEASPVPRKLTPTAQAGVAARRTMKATS